MAFPSTMAQKVVLCGAKFLSTLFDESILSLLHSPLDLTLFSVYTKLKETLPEDYLLPPVPVDVTKGETLSQAFESADAVVSLVGILHGSPAHFEAIQWKEAENVARAAQLLRPPARSSSISAPSGQIFMEKFRMRGQRHSRPLHCANATIIWPSLVFGPGDGLFNRFGQLSRYLSMLPVSGKGDTRFQPVYVRDIGQLVEILTRNGSVRVADGKIMEATGPDVLTFRQIMQLLVDLTDRFRPTISVPWIIGELQGEVMQRLPIGLFTITRNQIEQLKLDNVATSPIPHTHVDFRVIMEAHSCTLTSIHDMVPHDLK